MTRHFCFCLSLKSGACTMAFLNLMVGIAEFVTGIVQLCYVNETGEITLYVTYLLMGIITLIIGTVLLVGIVQGKEKYILFYLLLGSVCLLVVSIYSGINMFTARTLSIVGLLSAFMWYGQIVLYHFYEELTEYNNKVNRGVIEVTYNGDRNEYVNPGVVTQESVENTAV